MISFSVWILDEGFWFFLGIIFLNLIVFKVDKRIYDLMNKCIED